MQNYNISAGNSCLFTFYYVIMSFLNEKLGVIAMVAPSFIHGKGQTYRKRLFQPEGLTASMPTVPASRAKPSAPAPTSSRRSWR